LAGCKPTIVAVFPSSKNWEKLDIDWEIGRVSDPAAKVSAEDSG